MSAAEEEPHDVSCLDACLTFSLHAKHQPLRGEFKTHLLYASKNAAIEPLAKFAELCWRTKKGECHNREKGRIFDLWNREYDKLVLASLAKTGVKPELIDLEEVKGYDFARYFEFRRLSAREAWRLGWKLLMQGSHTAGELEEEKKSFWHRFENESAKYMTSAEAVAFRAELEGVTDCE
jgi:hypothetical protein